MSAERVVTNRFPSGNGLFGLKQLYTSVFIVSLGIKLVFSFFNPYFTTDLYRNLWYADQFWYLGFDVYKYSPIQINPAYNLIDNNTGQLAWPTTHFDYGVVNLMFYAVIVFIFGNSYLAVVTTKLVLLVFDLMNFYMLLKLLPEDQSLIAWVYWLASIPLASFEGQVVSITVFFMLGAIYVYKKHNNKTLAYLLIAFGFHWKYIPIIILPYLMFDSVMSWKKPKIVWKEFTDFVQGFIIPFTLLWFPLFYSPYILNYILYRGNLPIADPPWNPFYYGAPFNFSEILIVGFFLFVLYSVIREARFKMDLSIVFSGLPFLGLLFFFTIYKYAFPWYWLWAIPAIIALKTSDQKRYNYFKLFLGLCAFAGIEMLMNAFGVGIFLNRKGRVPNFP